MIVFHVMTIYHINAVEKSDSYKRMSYSPMQLVEHKWIQPLTGLQYAKGASLEIDVKPQLVDNFIWHIPGFTRVEEIIYHLIGRDTAYTEPDSWTSVFSHLLHTQY